MAAVTTSAIEAVSAGATAARLTRGHTSAVSTSAAFPRSAFHTQFFSQCAQPALKAVSAKRFHVTRASSDSSTETTSASASAAAGPLEYLDVLIESDAGVSYDLLRDKLAAGQWEEADNETRRLVCVLAGDAAAKRKWVYFTEVKNIPDKDLLTLDRLWRAYSKDRFGFSVQRRMWRAASKQWKPLFLRIGWTYGPNSTYKKFPMEFTWDLESAPVGHLPLTNALRGTQLIQGLFTHPAFSSFDAEETMPDLGPVSVPRVVAAASDSDSDEERRTAKKLGGSSGGSIFDEGFNSADYGF